MANILGSMQKFNTMFSIYVQMLQLNAHLEHQIHISVVDLDTRRRQKHRPPLPQAMRDA